MTGFDRFVMVDWSGGNDAGPTPRKDAIWIGESGPEGEADPLYQRNRLTAEETLCARIETALTAGERLFVGFDFPFGYPAGFAQALTGQGDPLAVWSWLADRIEDAPRDNNRFDIAGQINRTLGAGKGPFWSNALKRDIPGLPRTRAGYQNPFPERRVVETRAKGAFTCWQLAGAGAVGSQVLMGLPVLQRLRRRFPGQIAAWPFEPLDRPVALVEIWPTLIDRAVKSATGPDDIRDAVQVRMLSRALSRLAPGRLAQMLRVAAPEEGWILGHGYEEELLAALAPSSLRPPPLQNDCFALPPGVDWTPVDTALEMLRARLTPVVAQERVAVGAGGRARAGAGRFGPPRQPAPAQHGGRWLRLCRRDHPRCRGHHPAAGRGARGGGAGLHRHGPAGLGHPRADRGLSARGRRHRRAGRGLCARCAEARGLSRPGQTGRQHTQAGEDVESGAAILRKGRVLTAADLALASATGVADLPVFAPLRVGVLSTGDEVVPAGSEAAPGQIFDANRPMLLDLVSRFGHAPVDLGHVPDDRAALRARLDSAAADVILTERRGLGGRRGPRLGALARKRRADRLADRAETGPPAGAGHVGGQAGLWPAGQPGRGLCLHADLCPPGAGAALWRRLGGAAGL
jgi:molybdopterin molybdotransferase